MKRIAAFMLICLCLFNWGGYRVLFYLMEQQSTIALISTIDRNHYLEEDLVELAIPLELPYLADKTDFERIDGEITINGILYHYVKQKIVDNQLIIKCIAHTDKSRIITEKGAFSRSVNGVQDESDAKKVNDSLKKTKTYSSEYQYQGQDLLFNTAAIDLTSYTLRGCTVYQSFYSPLFYKPPKTKLS